MDISQMNPEQDITINKFNLDAECISLPGLYYQYSEAAQEAKKMVSEKSDMLKVITAERQLSIREQCATEGKKVTEAVIAAMVDSDNEVITARKELREAEATYARLNVAVSSIEIKKSEVDNLVKLYCNAMYANKETTPTKDFQSDVVSEQFRKSMTPLPKK